jgi:hypothetical protein
MNSKHYSEDDLTLLFYGEARRPDRMRRHLENCAGCAALFEEISGTLALIEPPAVPERGDLYGLEVWQRIRPLLPEPETSVPWTLPEREASAMPSSWWRRLGLAVGAVSVLMTTVSIGWLFPRFQAGGPPVIPASRSLQTAASVTERVRSVAIVDHLEQSERLLLELVNANGPTLDVSARQNRAAQLVESNRFYRQESRGAGETLVADVLDDLERSLLDIAHGPPTLSNSDLDALRNRLDSGALIFKVRVLADELDERRPRASDAPNTL